MTLTARRAISSLCEEHGTDHPVILHLEPRQLKPSAFSIEVYGDATVGLEDLREGICTHGVLVPLVVTPGLVDGDWEVISGHRRLACAMALGLSEIPCEIRSYPSNSARHLAILEYNRQRRKVFSQLMREADALEQLCKTDARRRRLSNLRNHAREDLNATKTPDFPECRNSDGRANGAACVQRSAGTGSHQGRTDTTIARRLGLGGKDLYRQARTIWRLAQEGDVRAQSGVVQLDAATKTIHAAYKDLRRRDRFTTNFRPTPYDVWAFRHDGAFGVPYPGSIPPAIVAHALHYFCPAGGLVVDPMAGGGTTLDVCQSMGRYCLAYDLEPSRPEIQRHDIRTGFPAEAVGCQLIFCDPPYYTMLASRYSPQSVATTTWESWLAFLDELTRQAFHTLCPGGHLALLLAPQTEKDLPAGYGYIDHVFFAYTAALRAGFLPQRRISCPMSSGYIPQHVRQARVERRLLGQVRDLLVVRRPTSAAAASAAVIPYLQTQLAQTHE